MLNKRCPFCLNSPIFYNLDNKYIIECSKCKKNNIIVKVIGDSEKEVLSKWNNREYDKYIKENSNNIKSILSSYNDGFLIKNDLDQNIIDVLRLNKDNIGIFIMPDLTIIKCNTGHATELLKYLDIDTEVDKITDADICLNLGIIRITIQESYLMVAIPNSYNKKQMSKLVDILMTEKFFNIKKYYLYENKKTELLNNCREFNNINDLILGLEDNL